VCLIHSFNFFSHLPKRDHLLWMCVKYALNFALTNSSEKIKTQLLNGPHSCFRESHSWGPGYVLHYYPLQVQIFIHDNKGTLCVWIELLKVNLKKIFFCRANVLLVKSFWMSNNNFSIKFIQVYGTSLLCQRVGRPEPSVAQRDRFTLFQNARLPGTVSLHFYELEMLLGLRSYNCTSS